RARSRPAAAGRPPAPARSISSAARSGYGCGRHRSAAGAAASYAARRRIATVLSCDAGSEAIVNVDDAEGTALIVDDEEAGDGPRQLVHAAERLRGEGAGANGLGLLAHDLVDDGAQQPVAHMAAQIAISDDADEAPAGIGDADAAEAFLGHDEDRLGHGGAERNERYGVAAMHHVLDRQELAAKLTAGMQLLEIGGR